MKNENIVLEELRNLLRDMESDAESIRATIAVIEQRHRSAPTPVSFAPSSFEEEKPTLPNVSGFTQLQAIVALAKHYGGTVKALDAKNFLLSSGLMRKTKNANNIVHSTIIRSGRFERIGPGEYRLLKEPGFFLEAGMDKIDDNKPLQ